VLDTKYAHLHHAMPHAEKSLLVFELPESTLTPLMEKIEHDFPGVRVFSLPSVGDAERGGIYAPLNCATSPRQRLPRGSRAVKGRLSPGCCAAQPPREQIRAQRAVRDARHLPCVCRFAAPTSCAPCGPTWPGCAASLSDKLRAAA
jgi:hypothetical protein